MKFIFLNPINFTEVKKKMKMFVLLFLMPINVAARPINDKRICACKFWTTDQKRKCKKKKKRSKILCCLSSCIHKIRIAEWVFNPIVYNSCTNLNTCSTEYDLGARFLFLLHSFFYYFSAVISVCSRWILSVVRLWKNVTISHIHTEIHLFSLSYIQLISNIYLNVRNTCSAWPAAGTTTKLAKKAQAHSDPTHNVFESEANRNKQQQKKKMQKWCGMYLLVCSLASHTVIVSNVERRWKSFYKFFLNE